MLQAAVSISLDLLDVSTRLEWRARARAPAGAQLPRPVSSEDRAYLSRRVLWDQSSSGELINICTA